MIDFILGEKVDGSFICGHDNGHIGNLAYELSA